MNRLGALLVLVACGADETETTYDTGAKDEVACGSTDGFVYGVVMDRNDQLKLSATVSASDGTNEVLADLDGTGAFEFPLTGGLTWTLTGQADGCVPGIRVVEVEACVEYSEDFDLDCG